MDEWVSLLVEQIGILERENGVLQERIRSLETLYADEPDVISHKGFWARLFEG